jgi:hypothetical protein
MIRRLSVPVVLVLLASGLTAVPARAQSHAPAQAQAWSPRHDHPRPIVFVHGYSGSGGQFETPARRFASNGYPSEIIEAHEYDSTFTSTTPAQVYAGLDARIIGLLARTDADRVDLTAHSLGTSLMQDYLNSSPERAARIAHYVNYDGATATAPPGGVPTLAIWGEGDPARSITGATNVHLGDESHTQTVTSAESFRAVYKFLTGLAPRTIEILPEPPGRVLLSGRAVLFRSNAGVSAGHLEIYQVDARTGHRLTRRPVGVFPLGGDGSWGPFHAQPAARYEFAVVRAGVATQHLYYQAFRRSDRLIRLLTDPPGGGLAALTDVSDTTTNLVVNRGKEWWGDQGAAGDALWIDGTSVLNAANAPRTKRVIGIFAYDLHLDGRTDLGAPIPAFFGLPFITGIDVHTRATSGGAGTVSVVARQRGGHGGLDVLDVPNWPSSTDQVSLQLNDYR